MKDLTDRELLDAIDRAMKTVVERFKAQREGAEPVPAEQPSRSNEEKPAA